MARPKLKNGYTMIANEALEALSHLTLSSRETRVLFFIIRKTYGWHKKTDLIALTQIASGTGLDRSNACHAVQSLVSRGIVVRTDNKQLGFQKNYEKWTQKLSKPTTRPVLSKSTMAVVGTDTTPTPEMLSEPTPTKDTKDTYTKDNEALTERQLWEHSIQTLEHTTGLPLTIDLLRKAKTFTDWKAYLDKSANKVGILMEAFRSLHRTAPDMDWQNTGGRIAVLLTLANHDPGYLLRIIWETAPADIAGSHLNYIQGYLRARQGRAPQHKSLPTGDELKQSWGQNGTPAGGSPRGGKS